MMLQIGDQLDRYQIRSLLAQGGMADLYLAYDLVGAVEVVLKIPNRQMLGDPAQYERFQRELDVTNTLRHPAVQRGLGSGQFNRTPYLVTRYVEGTSLRARIAERAPFPLDEALGLMVKITDGVAYCHENGVVHRDLKPENILMTPDGQPVILDFGLALTRDSHRVTFANFTPTAGTPDYMAPEQCAGERGGVCSDIYALGVLLHELLTGRVPYTGDTYQVVVHQHLHAPVPRLEGVPPGVAAIVARCLQKTPDARYPDARALLRDLQQPDAADLSALRHTGAGSARPSLWHNDIVRGLVIAGVLLAVMVLVALLAQGAARP